MSSIMSEQTIIHFQKMHGLGNDFIIIDARENHLTLTTQQIQSICDRKTGIGCDQMVFLRHSKNWQEMTYMDMYNNDGSVIEACGNMTRCVAHLLMSEEGVDNVILETMAGSLNCWREGGNLVKVDMGKPRLNWQDIPLSQSCDTLNLPLDGDPVGVNIGNPHCVFFVDDAKNMDDETLEELGRYFETHELFPEKTNVEFAQILSPSHIRLRVWERASGITGACGTGACATAVAAIRRGLTDRSVTITLDGGDLKIEWRADDSSILMTGPVKHVFSGEYIL